MPTVTKTPPVSAENRLREVLVAPALEDLTWCTAPNREEQESPNASGATGWETTPRVEPSLHSGWKTPMRRWTKKSMIIPHGSTD